MKSLIGVVSISLLCVLSASGAGDDYQPGPDSLPQSGVPKGEMLKGQYVAKEGSVFPGTEREYQIYLPAGLDKTKPAPFMVFQDGVIYQAPAVFDNLIAKKEIPPLIGIFIKPGVVPAANENALPRFNRSYEYDSVTDTYSRFLIDEFLPAIREKHKLNLSNDPNARAIAGSSSGGICAFMVAWHRPDQFRRVFTSVGTYVGIHGADQLAVLVRKFEPKPIRIHLQSGENDNDLYCGDWWMANQMMERSLTWNGYDVSHTWGTGGHNQKHATAILPDVLRGLWKGYPEEPVKANPHGESKWRGYEVVGDVEWEKVITSQERNLSARAITSDKNGNVYFIPGSSSSVKIIRTDGKIDTLKTNAILDDATGLGLDKHGNIFASGYFEIESKETKLLMIDKNGSATGYSFGLLPGGVAVSYQSGFVLLANGSYWHLDPKKGSIMGHSPHETLVQPLSKVCLSPDQTLVYARTNESEVLALSAPSTESHPSSTNTFTRIPDDKKIGFRETRGMTVDQSGRVYFCTDKDVQVCDQVGRVTFHLTTPLEMKEGWNHTGQYTFSEPAQVYDVCFGGKELSELFIACGDTIYKRKTKAKGYISGQMAPIKPAPPKL